MANGTRTLTLVIVLIVGLAVGWFIGHGAPPPAPPPQPTPAPTCPTAGDHLIQVGPKAGDVSEPRAAISVSKGHKVLWIARDNEKPLTITFKASDFPPEANHEPPFEGGQAGQDQVITCNSGGVCNPGRINPNLKDKLPDCPKSFYYKYWQKLGEETADAGIIIEK